MAGLPKKVAEIGQKADEEMERLKKEEEGGGSQQPERNTDPPNPPEQPPEEPPTAPTEPTGEDGTPKGGDPGEGDGIDWKAEAEARQLELDRVTHQHRVLQGKYDKEVPDLTRKLRELEERVETLSAGSGDGGDSPAEQLSPEKREELRELYGDDLLNLIASERAAAKAEAMEAMRPHLDRIEEVANETRAERQDRLHAELDKAHKDWRVIDGLQTWRNFLAEIDPNTGKPRGEAVVDAYKRFDSGPIIKHLSDFKRRSKKGSDSLASQEVPSDSGRTDDPPAEDKRTFKRADVEAFYTNAARDLKTGKMSAEDYDRLDAQYTKAEIEGRVI